MKLFFIRHVKIYKDSHQILFNLSKKQDGTKKACRVTTIPSYS